jgi:hypothetical protein
VTSIVSLRDSRVFGKLAFAPQVVFARFPYAVSSSVQGSVALAATMPRVALEMVAWFLWAVLGLNQWPLPCQGSALPLS